MQRLHPLHRPGQWRPTVHCQDGFSFAQMLDHRTQSPIHGAIRLSAVNDQVRPGVARHERGHLSSWSRTSNAVNEAPMQRLLHLDECDRSKLRQRREHFRKVWKRCWPEAWEAANHWLCAIEKDDRRLMRGSKTRQVHDPVGSIRVFIDRTRKIPCFRVASHRHHVVQPHRLKAGPVQVDDFQLGKIDEQSDQASTVMLRLGDFILGTRDVKSLTNERLCIASVEAWCAIQGLVPLHRIVKATRTLSPKSRLARGVFCPANSQLQGV